MAKTIVNNDTKGINQEIQTIATLSSSIAHEIKNYLAAINICAELSEIQLGNIRERIKAADYFIGNLQLQIKGIIKGSSDSNKKDFKWYSMAKNIEKALEHYPFNKGERELIRLDIKQDFEYLGNPVLTNHILYNLIKNSLRAIKNADKGKIEIRIEPGAEFNKLFFRDTATGIAKEFLPKVFVRRLP